MFFLIFFGFCPMEWQAPVKDTIHWSAHYRLTFDDFKASARPPNGLSTDTLATCAYTFDFRMFSVNNQIKITAVEECYAEQRKYDTWTQNTLGKEHYAKWIGEQLDSLGASKHDPRWF